MINYSNKIEIDGDPEKIGVWHKGVLSLTSFHNKKVLDIGCGSGGFLLHIRETAERVVGLDPNKNNCEVTVSKGIETINDYPQNIAKEYHGTFDVVTTFEVIEHLYVHNEIVHGVATLLRQGGIGIVTTPNAFNIVRRLKFFFLEEHHDSLLDPTRSKAPEHIRLWSYGMMKRLCREETSMRVTNIYGISSFGTKTIVIKNRILVGLFAQHLVAFLKKN